MIRSSLLSVTLLAAAVSAQSGDDRLARPFLGRVVQADGEPAPNVTVLARWRIAAELPGLVGWTLGDAQMLGTEEREVTTDGRGRFRVDVPTDGPVALVARGRDHATQSLRAFPVMAGGFVELRLLPTAVLGGRVFDDRGEPWAGCELALEPDRQTWSRLAVGAVPIRRQRFRTAADGTFRQPIEHAYLSVPQSEPFVALRAGNGTRRFRGPTVVRPLAGSDQRDFVPVGVRLVTGRVRDEQGRPVVGARVYVRRIPWNETRTDERGEFEIAAVRGEELAVRVGQRDQAIVREDVVDGRVDATLVAAIRLRCRLRAAGGAPLAGRDVLWANVRGEEPPAITRSRTDASGAVAFDGASAVDTTSAFVLVDGRWRRFLHRRHRASSDLGEVGVSWRELAGQVVDVDGSPVPAARVVAIDTEVPADAAPCCWVTYSDHGGRFSFASLPRVALRVMVEAGTRGLAHAEVGAAAIGCRVELARRAELQVNVAGPDGEPAASSWVLLVTGGGLALGDAPGPTFGSTSVVGICDANGQVRFRGLPQRSWRVLAHLAHAGTVRVGQAEATPGEDEVVDVRLQSR